MKRKLLINPLWRYSLWRVTCGSILSVIFLLPQFHTVHAQTMTLPYGFVEDVIVDGLWLPTSFSIAPDGRIFVVEKAGVVRVWQNGQMLPEPFIDMQNEVNSALDRGMLSIAVHPQFPSQPYIYVGYVYDPPETKGMEPSGARVARLMRLEANPANTNRARAGGGVVLLGKNSNFGTIGNPQEGEKRPFSCMGPRDAPLNDCLPAEGIHHTIGGLVFGRDGALYVGNGDGINSIFGNIRAQNLDSLAGKILRIDPLTGDGLPSNPYFDGNPGSNRSKVYLVGMRNPFRFNIHPQTGEVYVGDVGNDNWEEINIGRAGANFGWPCYEGLDQITTNPACDPLLSGAVQHTTGAYIYPHINSQGSVIGGDFYRGRAFPSTYHGRFFFGEFNEGTIMYLDPPVAGKSESRRFAGNLDGPVQIVSAADGTLYVLLIKPGRLSRIRFSIEEYGKRASGNAPSPVTISPASGAPFAPFPVVQQPVAQQPVVQQPVVQQPVVQQPVVQQPVTQPIAIDPTAVPTVVPVLPASSNPAFSDAIRSVSVQPAKQRDLNSPIYVSILEPADRTTIRIGDTVRYRGWATDAAGQEIADTDMQWTVLLHHNEHTHYDYHNGTGTNGSFTYLDHGDGVYLELCLTATAGGESNVDCATIRAQEVTYIFDTVPSGQPLIYNGGRYVTPFRVVTYVNAERIVSAPRSSRSGGAFISWSNGGDAQQILQIGNRTQTLTAIYTAPDSEPAALPIAALPSQNLVSTPTSTSIPSAIPGATPTSLPISMPTVVANGPFVSVPVSAPDVEQTQSGLSTLSNTSFPPGAFRVIHPGPTHTDSGRAYFSWETAVAPPIGQAFEIIFWKRGQDPVADGFGMNAPTRSNDVRIDLEALDKALGDLLLPGMYNWTVVLVNVSPYERLQIVADTREFVFERK